MLLNVSIIYNKSLVSTPINYRYSQKFYQEFIVYRILIYIPIILLAAYSVINYFGNSQIISENIFMVKALNATYSCSIDHIQMAAAFE